MAVIKEEDIKAYWDGESLLCLRCAKKLKAKELTLDDVLTRQEVEKSEDLYFRYVCKDQIY